MGMTCSTYGTYDKFVRHFRQKIISGDTTQGFRCRCENNNKMNLKTSLVGLDSVI
jgi:hypothetical protein